MTDTTWIPLSRRKAVLPAAEPIETVPDWLYRPLAEWLYHVLQHTDGPVMVLRPGHGLTDTTREIMIRVRSSTQPWLLPADAPTFLDAIDAAVVHGDFVTDAADEHGAARTTPDDLEQILAAANFAWRVNADWNGLERRVDPTVTAAVSSTIRTPNTEAAEHLAAAWAACHGRNPDPDKAYAEAVKAAEAAACALVLPNAGNATLGTVRQHLHDASAKWELVLPGKDGNAGPVTTLVTMLTALWEGQRSRHAGTASSRRQAEAEASAAVHLAATLVQWLTTGILRRRTP